MTSSRAPNSWWQPARHGDRRPGLLLRNSIKRAIRRWFENEGFVEVDTCALQISPGNETHLHAFSTKMLSPDLNAQTFYLHTSPEIACKKLLAAGEKKIFTFAQVFRNRERGALHHPEFTMLEWYRADAPMSASMADCEAILKVAADAAGRSKWTWRNETTDLCLPPVTVSLRDAFKKHLGFDLAESLVDNSPKRDLLARQVENAGHSVHSDDTWSDIFSRCLVAIEPEIWTTPPVTDPATGHQHPVFLNRYPAPEAPLARPDRQDERFADRFELFVSGVELANGYGELTDAKLLRQKLELEMSEKERIYGERYPIDEGFLAACSAMPPSTGCALGFDRLAMLAIGAERIDQVLWTPLPDPIDGAQS